MRNKKGVKAQVSMEFVLLIALSFVILVVFIHAIRGKIDTLNDEKEFIELNDIAYYIQSEFFMAVNSQEGYKRSFSLPEVAGGKQYNINVTGDYFLVLHSENHQASLKIPINKSKTLVAGGTYLISKDGGVINID